MMESDEYRIVTNGVRYQIQVLVTSKLMWWTWSDWQMLLFINFRSNDFSSWSDANDQIRIAKSIHEWTEVKDNDKEEK